MFQNEQNGNSFVQFEREMSPMSQNEQNGARFVQFERSAYHQQKQRLEPEGWTRRLNSKAEPEGWTQRLNTSAPPATTRDAM